MAFTSKKAKGTQTDFIVTSVGVCLAEITEKKKSPLLAIAYRAGSSEVNFVFTELLPKNKLFTREDVLSVIAKVENVDNVSYNCYDGTFKDVYVCRADGGNILDVFERNYESNAYLDGIAEIYKSNFKFSINGSDDYAKKIGVKFNIEISSLIEKTYDKNSYEYAIINAYNACLLGSVFEQEELQLETKTKKHVKIEVRNAQHSYVEEGVLYIHPEKRISDDVVDYYLTEQFNFVDGDSVSCRSYKIIYSNRFNDYKIIRT